MLYIIHFGDNTTVTVTKEEADNIAKDMAKGSVVKHLGACFSNRFILSIKPLTQEWFTEEYIQRKKDSFITANA